MNRQDIIEQNLDWWNSLFLGVGHATVLALVIGAATWIFGSCVEIWLLRKETTKINAKIDQYQQDALKRELELRNYAERYADERTKVGPRRSGA